MPFHRLFESAKETKRSDPQKDETAFGKLTTPSKPFADQDEALASANQSIEGDAAVLSFYERDNRALRIHRVSQASGFWNEYEKLRPNMPFLRYVFDTQLQAIEVLLSISCIHRAVDTGHIICTEPVTLGCYRMMDGRYEVFLAGEKLTYDIWSEATEKFSTNGGQYRDQLKPETNERYKPRGLASKQVVFKKEYCEINLAGTTYYQVFEAPTSQAAWSFLILRENVTMDPNLCIYVETPEGTICQDVNGIHRLDQAKESGHS